MRTRLEPLLDPPRRAPYFQAAILGGEVVLRTPSLHALGKVANALDKDHLRTVLAITVAVERGGSLIDAIMAARHGAADAVALVGALIGLAWADPVLELESPRPGEWTAEELETYGAAVYEELHEAGWGLSAVVACALAIGEQVVEQSRFEEDLQARAAFFARTTASRNAASSKPNASSSAAESEPSVS